MGVRTRLSLSMARFSNPLGSPRNRLLCPPINYNSRTAFSARDFNCALSVLFTRRYWGHLFWFLFLRWVICLSLPGGLEWKDGNDGCVFEFSSKRWQRSCLCFFVDSGKQEEKKSWKMWVNTMSFFFPLLDLLSHKWTKICFDKWEVFTSQFVIFFPLFLSFCAKEKKEVKSFCCLSALSFLVVSMKIHRIVRSMLWWITNICISY